MVRFSIAAGVLMLAAALVGFGYRTEGAVPVSELPVSEPPITEPPTSSQLSHAQSAEGSVRSNQCEAKWDRPVAAEIIDSFRRPQHRFAAGNRGLEFGTRGGEPVVAVDHGEIVFAGPVGGHQFLVVLHVNGVKSTYGYLREIEGKAGAVVARGDSVGRAEVGFHLTARKGGRYIDPEPFLDSCAKRVRLVPVP